MRRISAYKNVLGVDDRRSLSCLAVVRPKAKQGDFWREEAAGAIPTHKKV